MLIDPIKSSLKASFSELCPEKSTFKFALVKFLVAPICNNMHIHHCRLGASLILDLHNIKVQTLSCVIVIFICPHVARSILTSITVSSRALRWYQRSLTGSSVCSRLCWRTQADMLRR